MQEGVPLGVCRGYVCLQEWVPRVITNHYISHIYEK